MVEIKGQPILAWMRQSRLRCAAVLLLVAMGESAWCGTWSPNEEQVSARTDLMDPEYNQARAQFVWSDAKGRLWLGNIDRQTGLFYPPNGEAILISSDTLNKNDISLTLNGPEWVWAAGGDGIAYTTFAGKRHTKSNARLAFARPHADGTWTTAVLEPSLPRRAPFGSETVDDPRPRISYVGADNRHYWSYIDVPGSEQPLPGTVSKLSSSVRFARGANAVTYIAPASGVDQAFKRDLDNGAVTQLTTDDSNKNWVWMWNAPEFDNDQVFVVVDDKRELRVYRRMPQAGTDLLQWTPIYTAFAPGQSKLASLELFTFRGRSYVLMGLAVGRETFTSEIWVSNIDASAPLFRRVTDNSVHRVRLDPEAFTTNDKAFVYYTRLIVGVDGEPRSEGIFRADAGLGDN